jgi:hypothetical protein
MTVSGGSLLLIGLLQLALTAAPGVAAIILSIRRGIREIPVLLGIGLAVSGLAALAAFWAYFAAPWLGGLFAFSLLAGSIAVTLWCWPAARLEMHLLKQLSVPLALWVFGSLFVLFFGFLHGGSESPLSMAATRFTSQLPSDNDIPQFFSNWFYAGHPGHAPIFPPDWLSSDRPPLQIGYVLSQRVFSWDVKTLHYQVLGVVIQQLWIIGMWAVLVAARVPARTRSLAIVAVVASDAAIVNGFFVWPKLLAASFLLAAVALVVDPRGSTLKLEPRTTVLAGCLAGLAFLSHGSSVFGLIPLAVIAITRGLPSWRWLLSGLVVAVVLIASWSAYQHYVNPPGNRLTKWMLAGATKVDDRGATEAITDAYGAAGFSGAVSNKLDNFLTMAGRGPGTDVKTAEWIPFYGADTSLHNAARALGSGEFGSAIAEFRASRYLYLLPSLGLLLLGLPFIVLARVRGRIDGNDWRFARFCLWFFAIGAIAWGLLLFGSVPSRTIVFTGTLALPLLGICGIVAGLRSTFPGFAACLVAANALTTLLLYAPSLTPLPGSRYSALAIVATLAAAAVFVATVRRAESWQRPAGAGGA